MVAFMLKLDDQYFIINIILICQKLESVRLIQQKITGKLSFPLLHRNNNITYRNNSIYIKMRQKRENLNL